MIFRSRKVKGGAPSAPQLGLVSYPDAPNVSQGVPMWAPMAVNSAPQQIGRYGTPMLTQIAGYWPDVQKRCGVEGINRNWMVFSPGDQPYYFMQPYPQNPRRTLRDGGRPGQVQGPGSLAPSLGPARASNAKQAQSLATALLGW